MRNDLHSWDWHEKCTRPEKLDFCRWQHLIMEARLKEALKLNERFQHKPTPSSAPDSHNKAIDELFASCMPRLRKTADRLLRNREDSEDVLQDALLSGLQKIHQFERRAKFSTWMHTILRNSARNMWRRRRCRPIDSSFRLEDHEEDDLQSRDEIADGRLNPEEKYRQQESVRIVADLLAMLTPKYRDVVWLCKIQELNVTDTAERLGIRIGTVKARMHRARRMFAKYLNDREASQAARLSSARRLAILSPYRDAVPRTSAAEYGGIKRMRREHSHRARGCTGEPASPCNRLARSIVAHHPP